MPFGLPILLGEEASWHGLEASGTQEVEFLLSAAELLLPRYWQPHQKPGGIDSLTDSQRLKETLKGRLDPLPREKMQTTVTRASEVR